MGFIVYSCITARVFLVPVSYCPKVPWILNFQATCFRWSVSFLLVEGGLLVCVAELCGVTTAVNLKGTDSLHSQVTVTVAPEVLCCPMAPMHKYIYVVNIK
jgi:hypothetical protein